MKFFIAFCAGLILAGCLSLVQESAKSPAKESDQQQTSKTETEKSESSLGIVAEKSSEQPFVELPDGRYMAPYTDKIPGTDVEFEMIPIPGGTFTMGSPDSEVDRNEDEGPQFEVTVEPFWMGKYEVTWAEYQKFMSMDKVFKTLQSDGLRIVTEENEIDGITAPSALYDPGFTFEAGDAPEQPAASMTQFAAKQYTKWLSLMSETFYRLPTEAEWEFACRAGTTTAYYFGDDDDPLDDHAWHMDNADEERHPVGEKEPNPWGLYDMYGNVSEWVLDQYSDEGYTHVDGDTVTTAEAFHKPTEVYPRVLRGGSWELKPEYCRSAARLGSDDEEWKVEDPNYPQSPWWYTDTPGLGVGFRLMRPLNEPDTREAKESYWKADVEEIMDDSKNRIDDNGRGAFGTVDPDLPNEIQELTDEEQ